MDPLWATIAEFWWIGPATIGTGALGWLGLRRERRERRRRIELDAARLELRTAKRDAATARAAVRVARTELDRLQAERATGRASATDVAAARRQLDRATDEVRVATATARSRRAHVTAARAALPAAGDDAHLPVARMMRAHDEIIARWMTYETDPARLIAFPAMTDARQPLTAAFLAADKAAREQRPASAHARVTPAQFTAYRDAVAAAGRAFAVAEAEAWRQARAAGDAPARPQPGDPDARTTGAPVREQWTIIAQSLTQTALARGTEALARVVSARTSPVVSDAASSGTAGADDGAAGDPDAGGGRRVWPVPRRPRA
ncbi:hypothetical protein OR221_0245 [Microbacterium laevaniformans OR221]|nr:hypothetical protein OR221_0245 [Microbacterium laevaniformans OR221]